MEFKNSIEIDDTIEEEEDTPLSSFHSSQQNPDDNSIEGLMAQFASNTASAFDDSVPTNEGEQQTFAPFSFFATLSRDEQVEILRSIASDIVSTSTFGPFAVPVSTSDRADLTSIIDAIKNDTKSQRYIGLVNALPDDVKTMFIKKLYDSYMHKMIDEKIDCRKLGPKYYKALVNKMIDYCILAVPKPVSELDDATKKRRLQIKKCVNDYKARVINKCNQTSLKKVRIEYSLPGFQSRTYVYDAPFLPKTVTLMSDKKEGSCVPIPDITDTDSTDVLSLRISFTQSSDVQSISSNSSDSDESDESYTFTLSGKIGFPTEPEEHDVGVFQAFLEIDDDDELEKKVEEQLKEPYILCYIFVRSKMLPHLDLKDFEEDVQQTIMEKYRFTDITLNFNLLLSFINFVHMLPYYGI